MLDFRLCDADGHLDLEACRHRMLTQSPAGDCGGSLGHPCRGKLLVDSIESVPHALRLTEVTFRCALCGTEVVKPVVSQPVVAA